MDKILPNGYRNKMRLCIELLQTVTKDYRRGPREFFNKFYFVTGSFAPFLDEKET